MALAQRVSTPQCSLFSQLQTRDKVCHHKFANNGQYRRFPFDASRRTEEWVKLLANQNEVCIFPSRQPLCLAARLVQSPSLCRCVCAGCMLSAIVGWRVGGFVPLTLSRFDTREVPMKAACVHVLLAVHLSDMALSGYEAHIKDG